MEGLRVFFPSFHSFFSFFRPFFCPLLLVSHKVRLEKAKEVKKTTKMMMTMNHNLNVKKKKKKMKMKKEKRNSLEECFEERKSIDLPWRRQNIDQTNRAFCWTTKRDERKDCEDEESDRQEKVFCQSYSNTLRLVQHVDSSHETRHQRFEKKEEKKNQVIDVEVDDQRMDD